jgi:AcrR family transcriptional regulator
MSERPVKRKYDASSRQEAAALTRERICIAAEELFLRDGYARTSVRAVAKAAGVAEATMYVVFASKAALLNATILRAVADNASESLDVIGAAPPAEILPLMASSNAVLMARAGRMIALGDSAALMDAALRPFHQRAQANIRAAFGRIAACLDTAGLLRIGVQDAADAMYAIASDATYRRMTDGVGMTPEQYGSWLAATLSAVLLVARRGPRR